ncbi:MAG TPA: DsrE family protein [Candidatus Bathyarchaeia archaeon]|nr:DsrE family protein [Candidatus Bathyarchaeia archaeon]
METLTMILNTAPYGDEKVWNALRLSKAVVSVSIKMTVNIFLLGDAVTSAKKGQKPPEGYYNLQEMLKDLIDFGVKVIACRTCINARGLAEGDLIEGVKVGTMMDLAHWIEGSQKVLSF